MTLMPVLLGDNGREFSNPKALGFDRQGNQRTHVFYCDASAPYLKGSAERNHEFIRMFIPKATSLDDYIQQDISLMMNHINSYSRASLGNKCPYEMMEFLYGKFQQLLPDTPQEYMASSQSICIQRLKHRISKYIHQINSIFPS